MLMHFTGVSNTKGKKCVCLGQMLLILCLHKDSKASNHAYCGGNGLLNILNNVDMKMSQYKMVSARVTVRLEYICIFFITLLSLRSISYNCETYSAQLASS